MNEAPIDRERVIETLAASGVDHANNAIVLRLVAANGKAYILPVSASIAGVVALALLNHLGELARPGDIQAQPLVAKSTQLAAGEGGELALVVTLESNAELVFELPTDALPELAKQFATASRLSGPGSRS